MKKTKHTLTILLAALLLSSAVATTACSKDKDPSADTIGDTTVSITDKVTEPDVSGTTSDITSDTQTEPVTDAETDPDHTVETDAVDPNAITSAEATALLTSALEADQTITDGSSTTKILMDGELTSLETFSQNGSDFRLVYSALGMTEALTVVGNTAYYVSSYDDGEFVTDVAYRIPLTDEEKQELYVMNAGDTGEDADDQSMTAGLLASSWSGIRLEDGSAVLTSVELSPELNDLLLDETTEESDLTFEIIISPEGLMTSMRFTWVLPAELTGGEPISVSSETSVDYALPTIQAPANDDAYMEATYGEVFGSELPDIDPEEAAFAGLPLDGNNYVIGGGESAYDVETQYGFFCSYDDYYIDKDFTLYGFLRVDEEGEAYLSVGEGMEFWLIYPDSLLTRPENGAYVKVTATYSGYMNYGMVVSAAEEIEQPAPSMQGVVMYVTAYSLNVRTAPDSSVEYDNVIDIVHLGDTVTVLETGFGAEGNWCKIAYDCDEGFAYVSMKYLSETPPAV